MGGIVILISGSLILIHWQTSIIYENHPSIL